MARNVEFGIIFGMNNQYVSTIFSKMKLILFNDKINT